MTLKKIKVCYVISSLSNQGPPNVLYNIIQYMNFDQFDVSIITLVEEQSISRIDEFRNLPISVYQICPVGIPSPIKMFRDLKKKVLEIDPDILHTHCPRSMFLVPFLPQKYKKMETVHIFPGEQQKVMYGKIKGQAVIWLSHFFTKRMDLPIACSESVAASYKKEQDFSMKAIPNGCSLPIWEKNLAYKQNMRERLGLKQNLRYFIFVGRFSKEKNPDIILSAFKKLQSEYDNVGLILLGNGNLFDDIKKQENEKICVPGFKSNVYDYLIASDFYISASDVEGLANTLLESMTVGLPCVLSDIPSHREVLSKASETIGFLFNNKNQQEVENAMRNILNINVDVASKHIQTLFSKYYTAKHMSELYQNEYRQLACN
ncbi:glycosyltransferase [Fibrobacter sp. UWB11]|uniref:glycosyltransferase n=1 Tax=Fibrobacter sp. UWB11 TaxID=1896202 RepID=UPI00092B323C|nr:glycosyltransferase [Fibrobacter sp. UWB11]SIO10502.1 Glycosyltransferase involved in cell wall bisynthesis [Fibrobacter sp. UWB11]